MIVRRNCLANNTSRSQLTNNGGRADPNGRMGGDEVVEDRFMKMINFTAMARFGTKSWPS